MPKYPAIIKFPRTREVALSTVISTRYEPVETLLNYLWAFTQA